MWDYRARCLHVHDGDTVTLLLDNGFHSRHEEAIRLLKVSAPELSQPGGPETKQFVDNWMSLWDEKPGFDWPLYVMVEKTAQPEPHEIMTFTRYVGTIWTIDKKYCLNDGINAFLLGHPEWGKGIT